MRRISTRLISMILAIIMILSLAACGGSNSTPQRPTGTVSGFASADTAESAKSGMSIKGFFNSSTNSANDYSGARTDSVVTVSGHYEEPVIDFNTESYDGEEENPFRSVKTSPLSTFGADVDTASYSNVRRMILDGRDSLPYGAVRIEEMVNYFQYEYKQPKSSDGAFAIDTEIIDCPWNKEAYLLRIGAQTEKIDMSDRSPCNIVFLIDVSGSMFGDMRLGLLQKALPLLVNELDDRDKISIVTYAGADEVLLEGESGANKEEIIEAIEGLEASGSTNGAAGIITAYDIAEDNFIKNGNNRVILCTDGDLNVGTTSESDLEKLIKQKKKSGVFLSVLGVGTANYQDDRLETLADKGDGNYGYLDSLLEAKRLLVDNMGGTLYTVAKDAKFQIEFNPSYIKGYRQLGYENRQMAAEDFADDTKDGGEVGQGQQVTVLYEIIPVDSNFDIPGVDLKYQNTENTDSTEWLTISVRYKDPDKDNSVLYTYTVDESDISSRPSTDTKLAAAVASFAMLLKESEYSGSFDYDDVADLIDEVREDRDNEYLEELSYLISRADKLYG